LDRPSLTLSILSCLFIAVIWVLFVGGIRAHEMIVGFVVLVLSAGLLLRVAQREPLKLDFRMVDLLTCWRIPWYIVSDSYIILLVLLKDLAGIERAGSFYRFCGFKTSAHDPRLMAREVLATGCSTVTPNSIVIGIDAAQSRMLFHQLQPTEVSRMAKELGAQPGAERP
jgi:multisubunit Na+/H+ antiporter MnhE subunit